ncbi:hypothetical protein J7T55_015250 [Diaporthe amygdali]|uniref:uncharacterized protein n=1 Tax=Phomopsis amygdali TaxID=1214568 RepID=UPI0022FE6D19|nr:uncharacterized protein J7T55_015250 [Diaporthe amygdali]KAJ0120521.1 hypothetical protein J7T55_015250 [Diaporthe amygdali]
MVFRYKCCSSCAPTVRYYLQKAWGSRFVYEQSHGAMTTFEVNIPDPGSASEGSLIRMCFKVLKSDVAPHGILRLSRSSPSGNYRCKYA